MASGTAIAAAEMVETCWRGLRFKHPSDWEPSKLPGPEESPQAILVDRRYQRLHLEWKVVDRTPDLERMFQELGEKNRDNPGRKLTGVAGWTGLVRTEQASRAARSPGAEAPPREVAVVQAGRFFSDASLLVQAVITWPGRRDASLEAAVLGSIAPLKPSDRSRWRAMGLEALVPAGFELTSAVSPVGRVTWQFRRSERPAAGLSIERIAMVRYWLQKPLEEWLADEAGRELKVLGVSPARSGPHPGCELLARRRELWTSLTGRGVHRLYRAWSCPHTKRVYVLWTERKARDRIDWPEGLEVACCTPVRPESKFA